MTENVYDVIVIGAGPVGQTAADRCRAANLSVAVVEQELVGGECSYWGCVPSKALLRPVLALADTRRVDGAREAVTGAINTKGVFGRRDRYVTDWDDSGQADTVVAMGADLFRGHGRLDGERRVTVTSSAGDVLSLTARHAVVISSGSGAALPDVPGVDEVHPWTNRKATDSNEVPKRLAIVGGGGVAVEMATAWQGLGSSVTLLVRSRILADMESFVAEAIERGLTDAGVDVRTGVNVHRLRRDAGGVAVDLDDGATVEVDEVMFATGRKPLTGDMGLETVGLVPGTWLDTDDALTVTGVAGDWLYAAGDANHRALLTHQGKYQARIAAAVISTRARSGVVETGAWGPHVATADTRAVPQAFFTDPEAVSVGMTERQARAAGHHVSVVDIEIGDVVMGAKLYADGYRGRARMVVDDSRRIPLGVTMVGPGVSEMLHAATVAVAGEVPIDRLWHAVPCFPTVSELWLRLLEAYRDRGS
ncbi:NAD(P)/FAD-dependent oxidoreductase [Mycobacterium crocinum]|uniref:NAD(P)/FAD-dependent oxidoreductase n=1 Tax=Mycolicibacterium crocinum TaxID=388459 RepID=A0ABY3TFV0_9MYCO|nr:NAD(P)/FAD-dependent oxidoreductase [Mycolicibacterium crocinum]MCV7214329.1 NAD(P)/FAD-dependent oxidoreductase [Mycolicibacterium crocinum]ULN39832.1 NAD(P)/FAD-dependent oxidoreductase [Mycolicibacterium crocinum]